MGEDAMGHIRFNRIVSLLGLAVIGAWVRMPWAQVCWNWIVRLDAGAVSGVDEDVKHAV